MKIRFLKSYVVEADGGESYEEGQVVDLPNASAQHFLKQKGVAEVFNGKAAKAKKAEADADTGDADTGKAAKTEDAPADKKPAKADL